MLRKKLDASYQETVEDTPKMVEGLPRERTRQNTVLIKQDIVDFQGGSKLRK